MLSKKAKYAIKALVALAKHERNGLPLRIGEISSQEKIPKKFLEGILLDLRKAGILGSKMGINGGYYLKKNPNSISLTDIIRLTDGPIALVPCVSLNFYEKCTDCEEEKYCGLRQIMIELRTESLNILSNHSIIDLIKIEQKIIDKK